MRIGTIVLISYWSATATEAAARRVRQYCRTLNGQCDVITTHCRSRDVSPLEKRQAHSGASVHYVWFPTFLERAYISANSAQAAGLWRILSTHAGRCLRRVRDLANSVMVPDFRKYWGIAAGLVALRLQPSTIITTGPSMCSHWAGLLVTKFGSKVRWIVDLQDPLLLVDTTANAPGLSRGAQLRWCRYVLSRCDHVIGATESICSMARDMVPDRPNLSCSTISIGYEGDISRSPQGASNLDAQQLMRVSYIGNVGSGRPIEPLFKALAAHPKRDSIRLTFVGTRGADDIMRCAHLHGLHEVVRCETYVHGDRLRTVVANSFCLLTIQGNAFSYAISSKSLDYIISDKWILGLVPELSEEAQLLRSVGGSVLASPTDVSEISDALSSTLSLWASRSSVHRDRRLIMAYSPEYLDSALLKVIRRCSP